MIGGTFVGVGSAYQWWTEFDNWATLRDKYTPSGVAVPGAIFVARYGIYNAPDGHIGVVVSVNADGSFNTMEQNAGTWRYVGRYTRDYANILGFLVPKDNPATPAKTGVEKTESKHGVRRTLADRERKDRDTMIYIYKMDDTVADGKVRYATYRQGTKGTWWEFTGTKSAAQLASQLGNAMQVSAGTWDERKKVHS